MSHRVLGRHLPTAAARSRLTPSRLCRTTAQTPTVITGTPPTTSATITGCRRHRLYLYGQRYEWRRFRTHRRRRRTRSREPPHRPGSRLSRLCRTAIVLPTGSGTTSWIIASKMASHSFHGLPSERRRTRATRPNESRRRTTPLSGKSRSRGCCRGRRSCCRSQGLRRCSTWRRISPRRDCGSRTKSLRNYRACPQRF